MLVAPWRIGIDIGGTFTDVVAIDPNGRIEALKSPSRPDDPTAGVMAALDVLARRLDVPKKQLLGGCSMLVHGSTIATNTVLEGKGARVGLLTTKGFRDTLEIRRGIREEPWNHRPPFPHVLVPRRWRLPVGGRLDKNGLELAALDEGDIKAGSAAFRAAGVECVAVSFLHSYANGAHERRAMEILLADWDPDAIFCSHEISPYAGEYGRTSSTVLAAYVSKRVVPYLRSLEGILRQNGLFGPLLLIQSNGGIASVDEIARNPACLLLSGPAAQVGALKYVAATAGTDNLISLEMGGTSCDLALMEGGRVHSTDRIDIAGYLALVPSVDIHSVSAGGGSIARLDAGGMVTLGPDGAGSTPGPVCYRRGGQNPTNTDAHLVLGRLAPGPFAGGTLDLDDQAARQALQRVYGDTIGLAPEAAALGIIELMDQNLRHAVEHVSAERGFDLRNFTLVAVGGAGALHASSVARSLGCSTVYIPRLAGVFCAFGMLNSDVRLDEVRTIRRPFNQGALDDLERVAHELEIGLRARLMAYGETGSHPLFSRHIDLNYLDQQSQLSVEWTDNDIESTIATYEERYSLLYGHAHKHSPLMTCALRVSGSRRFPGVSIQAIGGRDYVPSASGQRRIVISRDIGALDVNVYDGTNLRPGARLVGPAVINDATTTIFIGKGDKLEVDGSNNLVVSVAVPVQGGAV
ncbi:hydantoinase/oxoprolinase family protein [Bradyrhizobium sp. CCBAU 51753]|uniref:hydantoinase/oxoprolinase family protein n=1 Tax=Bradyrhizobium sp. CCBAU 51753 TaxID=1325100 RepID=UPI00188ADC26|nr:hydantoinase/oxoprolinase family protein [Bradyrhizobium sp. CCBAU 51753]QOZ23913.1 hydantoinase/oxoprolinase family protein [Bradyrhizobium sp. CCBAU 51753]